MNRQFAATAIVRLGLWIGRGGQRLALHHLERRPGWLLQLHGEALALAAQRGGPAFIAQGHASLGVQELPEFSGLPGTQFICDDQTFSVFECERADHAIRG